MENKERLIIVLKHLIEHNHGHREDYTRWITLADEAGVGEVADLIREASAYAEQSGQALSAALKLLAE